MENGKITVKKSLSSTTIYLPKEKLPNLIGFLKHQIFEERANTQLIKELVNVHKIIFERE